MHKCRWLLAVLIGVAACPGWGDFLGIPKPGNISMEGVVVSVDHGGKSFTIAAYTFATPSANKFVDIDPPKRKVVTVSAQTEFFFAENANKPKGSGRRKFADLKKGDCVGLEGRDNGTGKPVPAAFVGVYNATAEQMFGNRPKAAPAAKSQSAPAATPAPGGTPGSPPGSPPTPPTASPAAPTPPTPTQAPATPQEGGGLPLPLIAGGGVALLVVLAAVVYVVKFRKRK